MSQNAVGIGEISQDGTRGDERRWAILLWLTNKMREAPHSEILEAATNFESFVTGDSAAQKPAEESAAKMERIKATAGRIMANAADAESDLEGYEPSKLRKPNRTSRGPDILS